MNKFSYNVQYRQFYNGDDLLNFITEQNSSTRSICKSTYSIFIIIICFKIVVFKINFEMLKCIHYSFNLKERRYVINGKVCEF